jgi:spore maturation protein CgeB
MSSRLSLVFLGLSITSSWGNGHATTYRALLRELALRGHRLLFLERRAPWYQDNADMPKPPFCETALYGSLEELFRGYREDIVNADAVILGSYVIEGSAIAQLLAKTARGVRAFYDIDTPITVRALADGSCSYLKASDVPSFDLYLSFSGGPVLRRLERELGARRAAPLYCSVDPRLYYPIETSRRWDLGYLGTYSADRQPALDRLLLEPARQLPEAKFVVAGPQYPDELVWPANVERREHVAPFEHCEFYASQRATLNVTRHDMVEAGYSPSVRLFEAAACGVPIVSDVWPGIDSFFVPGEEILLAESSEDVARHLAELGEDQRVAIGERARNRVLRSHTATRRAEQLEALIFRALSVRRRSSACTPTAEHLHGRPRPRELERELDD